MDIDLGAASLPKPALAVFPLEIWIRILSNLTSESDIVACYLTCEAWAEHLKPKILMPKVFPFIQKYFDPVSSSVPNPNFRSSSEDITIVKMKKQTQLTTILNIRRVSRFWKKAVNGYYEANAALDNDTTVNIFQKAYRFGDDFAKLRNFVAKGLVFHTNPIISRSIYYVDWLIFRNDVALNNRIRAIFRAILKMIGSQIWTCTFHVVEYEDLTELYEVLHTFLSLMPNLKKLSLLLPPLQHRADLSLNQSLDKLIQAKPFPRLEYLNVLTLREICYVLTTGILQANTQLRKLKLEGAYLGAIRVGQFIPDCLNYASPKLEKLQLEVQSTYAVFKQLRQKTWPLKVLQVHLKPDIRHTLKVMFKAFSTFGNTLEQLSFTYLSRCHCHCIQGVDDDKEIQWLRLGLPHLKEFVFIAPHFHLNTIDFLLGCIALQKIELSITARALFDDANKDSFSNDNLNVEGTTNGSSNGEDARVRVPPHSAIKFCDCIISMQNSNIWRILSKLKYLEISTTERKKFDSEIKEFLLKTNYFRNEDGTATLAKQFITSFKPV